MDSVKKPAVIRYRGYSMDRGYRFQQMCQFIETECHDIDRLREEIITRSKDIFKITENGPQLFDYDHMQLLEPSAIGLKEYVMNSTVPMGRLWIRIPCLIEGHHGVDCALIGHLTGIGCATCMQGDYEKYVSGS